MCLFITSTLDRAVDLDGVRAIEGPEGSRWSPMTNPYVQQQLPRGAIYFRLTGSICDCASALRRGATAHHKTLELPRRASGWSQAKRNRWLEQRGAIVDRQEAAARGDAKAWHAYLARVVETAGGPVGLMLHFYRGGVHDERIDVRVEPHRVRSTPVTMLQELEDDVLYLFS